MGNGKSLDKQLKELRKAKTLVFGGPVVLQGAEVLKARGNSVKLSKVAGGTLKVGVIAGFADVAFDLASSAFPKQKKKRK